MWSRNWRLINLCGCYIKTSLVKDPYKKALLTSNWCGSQPLVTAKWRRIWIVIGLTTWLKVSEKSIPDHWWNPLVTSWALYRMTEPSGLRLVRKIHLRLIMFCMGLVGTRVQVEVQIKASNSSLIAWCQWGIFCTWEMVMGSMDSWEDGVVAVKLRFFFFFGFKDIVFSSSNHGVARGWWWGFGMVKGIRHGRR